MKIPINRILTFRLLVSKRTSITSSPVKTPSSSEFVLLTSGIHSLWFLHSTWDAVLPELILHGLPSGYSSPSAAATWLCTTGPPIQDHSALHRSPQVAAPPALLYCGLLSSSQRLLLWGLSMYCASSRPHQLLLQGPLYGCRWRSANSTHGPQGEQRATARPSPEL